MYPPLDHITIANKAINLAIKLIIPTLRPIFYIESVNQSDSNDQKLTKNAENYSFEDTTVSDCHDNDLCWVFGKRPMTEGKNLPEVLAYFSYEENGCIYESSAVDPKLPHYTLYLKSLSIMKLLESLDKLYTDV